MSTQPALSIVLTGRNDDYGGDFISRFTATIGFNLGALADRGVPAEMVLVEWKPAPGRPLLLDIAQDALPSALRTHIRSCIVDPQYHDACTLNPQLAYLEYVAKNVGVRRARGRMVLATNTDIFLGRGIVDAIATSRLEEGVVYRAARIDLALGSDLTTQSWDTLEKEAAHARRRRLRPPLFAGGTGDFILLDRDSWHALRGFNEVYRAARVGVDRNFLTKAYGCGHRIADIGAPVYHVEHRGSYRSSRAKTDREDAERAWGKREWPYRSVAYENADNWGLRDAPERQLRPGATYLAFDWGAVPPVVDLRRVVLPLRRFEPQRSGV